MRMYKNYFNNNYMMNEYQQAFLHGYLTESVSNILYETDSEDINKDELIEYMVTTGITEDTLRKRDENKLRNHLIAIGIDYGLKKLSEKRNDIRENFQKIKEILINYKNTAERNLNDVTNYVISNFKDKAQSLKTSILNFFSKIKSKIINDEYYLEEDASTILGLSNSSIASIAAMMSFIFTSALVIVHYIGTLYSTVTKIENASANIEKFFTIYRNDNRSNETEVNELANIIRNDLKIAHKYIYGSSKNDYQGFAHIRTICKDLYNRSTYNFVDLFKDNKMSYEKWLESKEPISKIANFYIN